MTPKQRVSAVLVCAAVVGATFVVFTGVSSAEPCWEFTDLEKRFAAKVNFRRSGEGVGRLTHDAELSKVARTHSFAMKRRGEPFHSSFDQLSSRVTNWNILAENVGRGRTVKQVWRALLDGAGHESHIVDPRFTYMGVGVVRDGERIYVTIVFEGTRNPGTTLTMPSC